MAEGSKICGAQQTNAPRTLGDLGHFKSRLNFFALPCAPFLSMVKKQEKKGKEAKGKGSEGTEARHHDFKMSINFFSPLVVLL